MSKTLYNIDLGIVKHLVKNQLPKEIQNNTCQAIIVTLAELKQREKDKIGWTATEIIKESVKYRDKEVKQTEDKYQTTWDYYKKKLMTHGGVIEVGSVNNVKNLLKTLILDDEEDSE